MQTWISKKTWIAAIAMAVTVSATVSVASAEVVLKKLTHPIEAELQTPLNLQETQVGEEFEAIASDDYVYQGMQIPAGTRFQGEVIKQKPSRRFFRPGYFVLDVRQVTFPDGEVLTFEEDEYRNPMKKVMSEEEQQRTLKRTIIEQAPITAAGLGTSIPLRTATDLNGGVITAITYGARMATGAVIELFKKQSPADTVPGRFAYGAFRGTGIPAVYRFVTVADDPDLGVGTEIPLRMHPGKLGKIFQASVEE